jgi:hypothetical protein
VILEALRETSRRLGPAVVTPALVAVGWTTGIPVSTLWRVYRKRRRGAGCARWATCG